MKRSPAVLTLLFLIGCRATPASAPLAQIPEDCTTPGEIIHAELSVSPGDYSYGYRVYLPPCFSEGANLRYPVLYLVPGRGSGPGAWFASGLGTITDQLILNREIPPLIIITTENTDSDPLAEAIYEELIPAIDREYPVMDSRQYRVVAGGSLGGVAAYRLAFQYPDEFSSAGIFGAGAISGEEQRIHAWLSAMNDGNRVRVFMDCGDEDTFMLERAEVMKRLLDEAGVDNTLHVGRGGHNYGYWLSNFEMYLKWVSQDWH